MDAPESAPPSRTHTPTPHPLQTRIAIDAESGHPDPSTPLLPSLSTVYDMSSRDKLDGSRVDLSQFMPANEASGYASMKSASHGVVSNMAIYIGLLTNPSTASRLPILIFASLALGTSAISVILVSYLYTLSPVLTEKHQPARFSHRARRINGVVACLSPVVLLLNMVLSALIGRDLFGGG
ncbi:hypothetical protein HDV00_011989 [Rhizophlyctis rosea]|nr:hypothetical protein HDV00_011989 [Rhizophlyctis rosea]